MVLISYFDALKGGEASWLIDSGYTSVLDVLASLLHDGEVDVRLYVNGACEWVT